MLTLLHEIEMALFDTAKTVSTGATGGGITTGGGGTASIGPFGAPETDRGALAPAEFEATIEKTYDVPFASPVTVHAPLVVVHD